MTAVTRAALLSCAVLLSCRSGPSPVETPSGGNPDSAGAPSAPAAAGTWRQTPPPPPIILAAPPAPTVSRVTLSTGLRVVVVEQHRRPVVVVTLVLPRGALMDPPSDSGMTYMAVSLATDFYEQSATGDRIFEEKSLRRQAAEMGGAVGSMVQSDFSMIRISGYAQDAREYLRMLARAAAEPRHGERSFLGRRNAALDAIEDLESSDPEALQQLVADAAFGQGHPYARSVIGTTASLTPLGLEDVITHQQRVFVPRGATLLVVGDVRPVEMLAAATAAFGRWTGDSNPPPQVWAPVVPAANSQVAYLERRSASTLLVCATRPLPDVRGEDAGLDVLAAILGRGVGGRLGATLRDRNGLTYLASADVVRRRQARAFVACSPLRADQAEMGVRLFRQVLDGAGEVPPTAAEVQRAKAICLADLESAYDDAYSTAQTWVHAITVGTGAPRLEEERADLERVTPAAVQRLARTILRPRTTRWVVSGDRAAAIRAVEANGLGHLQRFAPGG
jgi:zinc protease